MSDDKTPLLVQEQRLSRRLATERDQAVTERDQLAAQNPAVLRVALDKAHADRATIAYERDQAVLARDQAVIRRDQEATERDSFARELERVIQDRTRITADRDALVHLLRSHVFVIAD